MSWVITGSQKNKGVLDEFTGAAAAYSLRDLTFLRGGPVVRVRRSSDNAEQDFTAIQITDGTLAAFYGAGTGFVRTWYDQSGNGFHAQQATTTAQPQILLSDTNSKPTISFDGSNDLLRASAALYNQLTIFGVQRFRSTTGSKIAFGYGDYRADIQIERWQIQSGLATVGSYTENTSYGLRVLSRESGNSKAFNNGAQSGSTVTIALTQSATTTLAFGNRVDLAVYTDVNFSELILYPSIVSDGTRAAIETNINAHYAIY
jgi:hypothetical protein